MTPEDEEFNRIEREANARLNSVSAALISHAENLRALQAAMRPVLPDALTVNDGESPDYTQGWNDCREAMMRGRGT